MESNEKVRRPVKKSASQRTRKKGKIKSKRQKIQMLQRTAAIIAAVICLILIATAISCMGRTATKTVKKAAAEIKKKEEANLVKMQSPTKESKAFRDLAILSASFAPQSTELTAPSNMITQTGICVNDQELTDQSTYAPEQAICFESGDQYTQLEGVITFRGNNFRDTPAYGYANISENVLETVWSADTGGLGSWTGSGWTGQPLLVKWPQKTKEAMNMQDWAKQKENLVEVIYACMDGYVYFMELETGEATREPLYLGYTFKGAGALDPRGYPIMYLGAGIDSDSKGAAHVFVINLLDCSVMYEFGAYDSYSLRGSLSYFDSSALVDAETDTLIYPGENGILYLLKLNTQYDETAGTLTVNPDPMVKWHYYGTRSSAGSYWVGMEDSAAVYKGYLYIADNGGHLMCINLNTLQLVWVQDILDDSNSSPVLSVEDGKLYLYVSTSFRLGWRSSYTATVPIWKIDAQTGEIIWQKEYECFTEDGVSGGVQSTIATGKNALSDYIYVTVSKTGEYNKGVLACIDKKTGEAVWEHQAFYAWSSPVCVYNTDGSGKVIYCDSSGKMFLIDGITGEELNVISLGDSTIEASPAVFNDFAVVGTRGCKIWGIKLK